MEEGGMYGDIFLPLAMVLVTQYKLISAAETIEKYFIQCSINVDFDAICYDAVH